MQLRPHERITLGLSAEQGRYDFRSVAPTGPGATLGLLDADYDRHGIDLAVNLPPGISLNSSFTREMFESRQAGSGTFSLPNWTADNEDEIDTFSFGFEISELRDNLSLGFDYTDAGGTGKTVLRNVVATPPFPDLNTRIERLSLSVRQVPRQQLALRFGYVYEHFRSSDFAIDGLDPGAVANLLALGVDSFNYRVHYLSLTASYRFGTSEILR